MAFDAGSVTATLRGNFSSTGFHQFSSAMYKARADMTATEKAISDSSARSRRSLETLGHAAKVGAVGGIAALGVAIGYSVKKAADFEQQLSSLKAVTKASATEMGALKKQAMDAGAATKFSALDAAQAQTELAKGGLSTAQILGGGLKAALALAAAGELDLADAATYTVNAIKLFKIPGQDAIKVADMLATAANTTTGDVQDFGMALTQGGSAAKQVGYDLNETVTILEALAEIGVKNSDAGTSMKTALLQLISPTKKQAQAAKDAGISFVDQHGGMKSVTSISAMLRAKTEDMTKTQRAALFQTLAGTDGFRTLAALYDAGPAKLERLSRANEKQGTAAQTAAIKQDNLKGKLENLQGSVETTGIAIGSKLLPGLEHLAEKSTTAINAFVKGGGAEHFADGIISGAQTAGEVVGDLVPIAKTAAGALVSLGQALDLGDATHVEAILGSFLAFKVVGALTPMVIAFGSAVQMAFLEIATASSAGAGIAALTNPLIAIPAAAALAVGALILLSGHESESAQLARQAADAHRDLAAGIKSVQDAERAAADKGLASQQANLDRRQARQNTRNVLKDVTGDVQQRHPSFSPAHAENAAKDSDRYKSALIAEEQAVLRARGAHDAYRKSLDDQHGKNVQITQDAQKRLSDETALNSKLRDRKRETDAMSDSELLALGKTRSSVDVTRQLEASNKRLAVATRDYMQAQARAAVTDASRTRLMNQSTQITNKNAAGVANLIGFLNVMPKSKQTRLLLSDQNVLGRIGQIVGALRNVVPRKQIQVILQGAETAKSALLAVTALQNGVPPKKVANIVTNARTEKGEIGRLKDAIRTAKGKSAKVTTGASAETTKVQGLQTAIDNLHGKTVKVTVETTKVKTNASGRRPGAAESSLVGEGRGAELVGNPQTGFMRVSKPTLMPLGAEDWVLPVEQYPQRALSMMMEMLGLRGYKGGKPAKKKPRQHRPHPKHVDPIAYSEYLGPLESVVQAAEAKVSRDQGLKDQKDKNQKLTKTAKQARARLGEERRKLKAAKAELASAKTYGNRIAKFEDLANIYADDMTRADNADDGKAYNAARLKREKALGSEQKLLVRALNAAGGPNATSAWARELRKKIGQTEIAISDTAKQSPNDDAAASDSTFTKPEQDRLDRIESDIALAALTDTKSDDLTAEQSMVDFLTPLLAQVQASGGAGRGGFQAITDIAGQLKSAQDAVKDLSKPPDVTADQQAQADQAFQRGLAQGTSSFIDRLTSATLSGAPQLTQNIYTLHPGDPRTQQAIGNAAVSGVNFQGGRPASVERIGP